MLRILRNTILLLLLSIHCFAQSGKGTVKGQVIASDSTPAAFVPIGIKGTTIGTTTDANGNYKFKAPEGNQTLLIQFVGHEPEEKEVVVAVGETVTADFTLKENTKELQEVVITGGGSKYKEDTPSPTLRLATPLLETPQNIQIVTKGMLKDQQVISMSDGLIRNVSGLIRLEHWGDLYTNINARGSQVQAFRNGFNVVNSYWGPLTEDMSFVERIEFVKGPAGFMLSNGDPAGLYNVVTKKPTGKAQREVSFTYGSFNLYRGSLDWDGKLSKNGKLLFRLNLAAQKKQSHRPYETNDRYTIAPVVSYQLGKKTKLTAEYTYQRANMTNLGSFYVFSPSGYGTYPVDFTISAPDLPMTNVNDHSLYFNAQHQFNQRWKLTAQVGRFDYHQIGSSMWPSLVNPDGTMIRNVSSWEAKSTLNMAQVFVNGEEMTGSIRHRFLGGIDMARKRYLADWGQGHELDSNNAFFDPRNPHYGPPVTGYPQFDFTSTSLEDRAKEVGGTQDQEYIAFYLQDELGFWDNKVRLTLAGRQTFVKQSYGADRDSSGRFTPRVGLSISLNKQTSVYGLYDEAFTPQSGVIYGGGKVKPLTGNNIEFGLKRDWMGGKWNTTFAVYRIIKNDELTSDPEHSLPGQPYQMPLGQKRAQGIEFDLKGSIFKELNLTANYALTDARVTKVGERVTSIKVDDLVPSYAKHTVNSWVSYQLQSGLLKGTGVSLGCTYLAGRITYWELSPDNIPVADYFKLDGGLFWENSKIKVTANMYNILNEYLYSGSWYGWLNAYYYQTEAPRNGRISISYKF